MAGFEKLYETGHVTIHNHTVNHPLSMPGLSAAQQFDEISGQEQGFTIGDITQCV